MNSPPVPESFAKIEHMVVLMLENRSFDHLFGRLNALNPLVAGLTGNEFNYDDPNAPQPGQLRKVYVADQYDMPFDPPHEFPDVQVQLFGPAPGTGAAAELWYDHSSIPATLAKRFGFQSLTQRDAQARTLDAAVNLANPRLGSGDAPMTLPAPATLPSGLTAVAASLTSAASAINPISDNQRTFLALALACDLEVTPVMQHPALRQRYADISSRGQAADYIKEVTEKVQPAKP